MITVPHPYTGVNAKADPERVHAEGNYQKSRKALEHRLLLMDIKSSSFYHKMKTFVCPVLPDGRARRPDFEQPDYNEIYGLVARHWETTPGSDAQDMELSFNEVELLLSHAIAPSGGPGLTEERAKAIAEWLLPDISEIPIDESLFDTLPEDPNFRRWLDERASEYQVRRLQPGVLGHTPRLEDLEQATQMIRDAIHTGRSQLSARTFVEIMAMEFDPNDTILGDNFWSRGQMLALLGPGGVGKSRLALQMAVCVVGGLTFLGMTTRGRGLRWLFLQTENSNRRLKRELHSMIRLLAPGDVSRFNRQVVFHSLENELDGVVMLSNPEAVTRVSRLIQDTRADVIVIDPLRDFGVGNLDKDDGMIATLHTLSRICRRGDPRRSLLVIHHARTGREAAASAVGFDKASFGRNSKALYGYVRGQLNVAPAVPDNSKLIIACGKSNDGPHFQPFAVKLNERLVYEIDPDFDVEAWEEAMQRRTGRPVAITSEQVIDLCRDRPLSKTELVTKICELADCSKKTADRAFDRANSKLDFDPQTKLYKVRETKLQPPASL